MYTGHNQRDTHKQHRHKEHRHKEHTRNFSDTSKRIEVESVIGLHMDVCELMHTVVCVGLQNDEYIDIVDWGLSCGHAIYESEGTCTRLSEANGKREVVEIFAVNDGAHECIGTDDADLQIYDSSHVGDAVRPVVIYKILEVVRRRRGQGGGSWDTAILRESGVKILHIISIRCGDGTPERCVVNSYAFAGTTNSLGSAVDREGHRQICVTGKKSVKEIPVALITADSTGTVVFETANNRSPTGSWPRAHRMEKATIHKICIPRTKSLTARPDFGKSVRA